MEKAIKKELQELERIKKRIGEGNSPSDSSLVCRKIRGRYRYYIDRQYVSMKKDAGLVRELALSEYRKELEPVLEAELSHLRGLLGVIGQLSEVYYRLHEGKRVLIEPDVLPIQERIRRFLNEEYAGLPFDEDDRTAFFTNRGERVRSKSEKIIADEFNRLGIPYRYEKPLKLFVDGKMREFYPDFTAMNITTGELKYVEHLGMMDNPAYFKNLLSKLDVYEKNNLLIGRDVLLLHESSYRPLNTRVIADYVNDFLM